MKTTIARGLRAVLTLGFAVLALAVVGVGQAFAQSPTPEGTEITNTATVTFTDANGNSYDPVDGQVTVTVGFTAGIDVSFAQQMHTPAAGTADNTFTYTIDNIGNGPDTVSVSETNADASIITNVRYQLGATTYATLAELNAALAAVEIPAGGDVVVTVLYDVASGSGGESVDYRMDATSFRDGAATDFDVTTVEPPMTGDVVVTPDGGANLEQLPSNGTQYSAVFTVENQQSGADTFDLLASSAGSPVITIVSVDGVAGTSASISLAGSGSQDVTVLYTIGDAAEGAQDTLTLTATSQADANVTDDGFVDLTVVRPALSITKQAFRDGTATEIGASDRVLPGEYFRYRITVENTGSSAAVDVSVVDNLPAELTYDSVTGDGGTPAWSFPQTGATVEATLPDPLAVGDSRYFWIRVQVQ